MQAGNVATPSLRLGGYVQWGGERCRVIKLTAYGARLRDEKHRRMYFVDLKALVKCKILD